MNQDYVKKAGDNLAELRKPNCSTYRLRLDELRSLVVKHPTVLETIGVTMIEILQHGARHAASAVAGNSTYWMVDMRLKNEYLCEIERLSQCRNKQEEGNVIQLKVSRMPSKSAEAA